MLSFLTALISPITNIADKLIIDKDRYAEIQLKKIEIKAAAQDKLLSITTTPTVDAITKLLIVFRDIVLPLLRPLGSFSMTAFAAYAAVNNIELSGATEAMLIAAFPGWMGSRHIAKKDEAKRKAKQNPDDDFED